ncbi:MAG: hypothetical protein WC702_01850 [Patescibacteria group bacterium]|jgi:hypothetical protein
MGHKDPQKNAHDPRPLEDGLGDHDLMSEEREQTARLAPPRPALVTPLPDDRVGDLDESDLDSDEDDFVSEDGPDAATMLFTERVPRLAPPSERIDVVVEVEPPEGVLGDGSDPDATPAGAPSRVATLSSPYTDSARRENFWWVLILLFGLGAFCGITCSGVGSWLIPDVLGVISDNTEEAAPTANTDAEPAAELVVPAAEPQPEATPAPVPEPVAAEPVVAPAPEAWVCDQVGTNVQIVGTPEAGYTLTCDGTVWACGNKAANQDGTVTLNKEDCTAAN